MDHNFPCQTVASVGAKSLTSPCLPTQKISQQCQCVFPSISAGLDGVPSSAVPSSGAPGYSFHSSPESDINVDAAGRVFFIAELGVDVNCLELVTEADPVNVIKSAGYGAPLARCGQSCLLPLSSAYHGLTAMPPDMNIDPV